MSIFCRPIFIVVVLALTIVLVLALPTIRQFRAGDADTDDFDVGKWILVGLLLVAVVGLGFFLIYTFTHVGRLGGFGC